MYAPNFSCAMRHLQYLTQFICDGNKICFSLTMRRMSRKRVDQSKDELNEMETGTQLSIHFMKILLNSHACTNIEQYKRIIN